MQKQLTNIVLERLNPMKKKLEFLIDAKIYDRKKMLEASESIDKLQRKVSGLNSVKIIRKFRGII